jgi:hypothetical protein
LIFALYFQGKYKPVLAEENVFDGFDKDESRHPWPEQKPEDNVFADTPDKYPFNEKRGGHEWKKWEGSTATQALDEVQMKFLDLAHHSN